MKFLITYISYACILELLKVFAAFGTRVVVKIVAKSMSRWSEIDDSDVESDRLSDRSIEWMFRRQLSH